MQSEVLGGAVPESTSHRVEILRLVPVPYARNTYQCRAFIVYQFLVMCPACNVPSLGTEGCAGMCGQCKGQTLC
jgi:hypothetical protein